MTVDRSLNEWRLMISLINYGYDFDEIYQIFLDNPGPGKFREKYRMNGNLAYNYLKHTYDKANNWVANNPGEGFLIAQEAAEQFIQMSWPGISGGTDRAVFKAIILIALRCKKRVFSASCREIGLMAQVSPITVSKSFKRLTDKELIKLEQKHCMNNANTYSLGNKFTLSTLTTVRECKVNSTHELFCHKGLGKSAEIIWDLLLSEPRTEDGLIIMSGKHPRTIKKWLGIMSRIIDDRTGEIIQMVNQIGDYWHANTDTDLDRIAEIYQVSGRTKRLKILHQEERRQYKHYLEFVKKSITTESN